MRYGNSLQRALRDTLPWVKFEGTYLEPFSLEVKYLVTFCVDMKRSKRGRWKDPNAVRQFFLTLATEMQFDPTIAENWTKVTSKMVIEKVNPSPPPSKAVLLNTHKYLVISYCREAQPY